MTINPRHFPSPADFGLPVKFSSYRAEQVQAICDILDSRTATDVLLAPTGFGKSILPASIAAAEQCRVLIVVQTLALADQYLHDLESMGLVDLRGAVHYACPALARGGQYSHLLERGQKPTCDHGPCRLGMPCRLKENGCPLYDQVRAAQSAEVVVTSYALHIAHGKLLASGHIDKEPLGEFDYVFFDEGHAAADELSRALTVTLTRQDVMDCAPALYPPRSNNFREWYRWAQQAAQDLGDVMETVEQDMKLARLSGMVNARLLDFRGKLMATWSAVQQIASARGQWVVDQPARAGVYQFEPVWPGPYAEELLFRGAARRVLMSATILPATVKYINLDEGQFTFHEYPSSFPVTSRPVYQQPVVRDHYKMSAGDKRIMQAAMDNWFRTRDDIKALVQAVSFKRSKEIVDRSQYSKRMMTHGPRQAGTAVKVFKAARPGTVLVSPSLSTGYDFPGRECELIIIPKVPMPNPESELMKARTATDPMYRHVYATQEIVQMSGRAMRSRHDRCEVVILDSTFGAYFNSKSPALLKLLPVYFRQAIRFTRDMPRRLDKL